jgi:glycosyltransferase involved in cell wall biosynthesis
LPAVEAACGCPVAATTESPLPELLAGGGIFFDPRGGGLEPALEEMLGSEELRRRLGEAAAAHQMLDVIRNTYIPTSWAAFTMPRLRSLWPPVRWRCSFL